MEENDSSKVIVVDSDDTPPIAHLTIDNEASITSFVESPQQAEQSAFAKLIHKLGSNSISYWNSKNR